MATQHHAWRVTRLALSYLLDLRVLLTDGLIKIFGKLRKQVLALITNPENWKNFDYGNC